MSVCCGGTSTVSKHRDAQERREERQREGITNKEKESRENETAVSRIGTREGEGTTTTDRVPVEIVILLAPPFPPGRRASVPSVIASSREENSAPFYPRMPSAEETTYLIGVPMRDGAQGDAFLARDVDLLVSQIKENLRLSSLKAKSSVSHKNSRPSPYRVPARSWADPSAGCEICGLRPNQQQHHHHHMTSYHHHHHHHHQQKRSERNRVGDDPYEVLQELLREGGLIKEAVKRLQANLDDLSSSELEEDEDVVVDDEDDERRSCGYRRKPYFYDSEDEPLPSMYEPLEL